MEQLRDENSSIRVNIKYKKKENLPRHKCVAERSDVISSHEMTNDTQKEN